MFTLWISEVVTSVASSALFWAQQSPVYLRLEIKTIRLDDTVGSGLQILQFLTYVFRWSKVRQNHNLEHQLVDKSSQEILQVLQHRSFLSLD